MDRLWISTKTKLGFSTNVKLGLRDYAGFKMAPTLKVSLSMMWHVFWYDTDFSEKNKKTKKNSINSQKKVQKKIPKEGRARPLLV